MEVALLAEGVDRNDYDISESARAALVALLAEGVDRNRNGKTVCLCKASSPSSRRAWIEI